MDKCPKCGAEVRRNTYPFSSSMVPAKEWLCGTYDKWMNGVCVGTNQSEQCLRNQLATVTAERDHLKAADNPEWDCTDCAHPAWWRGHEHTAKSMCQIINEILDGEDDGRGVANEPWESTRRRIRDMAVMAVKLAAAEQRVRELECDKARLDWLKESMEAAQAGE